MKIFYNGKSILQVYIPSLIRGHNIIKAINSDGHDDKIFDIDENDSEILFKFHSKHDDIIIPYLKPKTSGANISPFSVKNLPRNKYYKIPDEDLVAYKNIVSKISSDKLLSLGIISFNFIKSLATKKNPMENIKADMALKGLKGKEYIHSLGSDTWNKFIKYLENNLPD